MEQAPKWFGRVAIAALLWNLLGCAAYLMDVMLTPEDIAKMTSAQQAMHAARPAWSVGATAIAVWGGAAGCVGLMMRKRWATLVLIVSLVGILAQDASLFLMGGGTDITALVLQGLVLVIGIGLVQVARTATTRGWLA